MIKAIFLIGAALVVLSGPASADTPNTATTGKDFADTAASSDKYEREAARIAGQRASAEGVRTLARMLDAAHTQSSTDLAMAASEAGVAKPDARLSPGQEKMLDALRKADGADFDKLYLQQQAQVHQDAKGSMETYAMLGQEPALRMAAAKTAPMIRQHLGQVTQLQHAM